MANIINGTDTGSGGLITTGDSSDELQLQTAETARVTLTNTAVVVNEGGNDVDFRVEGDTNANLLFVDASADRVGIGTGSPSSILHVSQDAPLISATSTNNSSGLRFNVEGTATTTYRFQYGGNTQATIDSSGNMGIGVTPETWTANFKALQIGSTAALVYFPSSDQTVLYNNTYHSSGDKRLIDGSATYYSQASGAHFWGIAGSGLADSAISFTSAMTLDASGNLLVGTTNTDPTFNRVNGLNMRPDGRIYSRGGNWDLGLSTSSGTNIYFYTDNGSARVTAGSITSNGATTAYGLGSDYRMKTNVQPMQGALAKVLQLNPVTYTWKEEFAGTNPNGQGFIAHELQEICPDAVVGEKDAVNQDGTPKYQCVDTSFLVATLTAAIKELKAELDTVKAELATLKGQ